jgi:hypothetical protein
LLALASALAVAVLLSFPLYFQTVNASFEAGTIDAGRVGTELKRWSRWHWTRTALGLGAFVAALCALSSH